MKPGISIHTKVRFSISLNAVSKIEFIFKNEPRPNAPVLKYEVWTADGSEGSCKRAPGLNVILVPWDKDETYNFKHEFFMDTRITLANSGENPETKMMLLKMEPTLFDRDDNA